eukprot:TRINITY_DN2974_c0_g1_i2.p1 TRINITY_DN2974_c0_g1~~TRINITY_DN2974_c0_g1_i2.p1  ORF type:complete len:197 (-),score=42.03 TRINITY_DN2974_c0_g1_i2:252-806(-)
MSNTALLVIDIQNDYFPGGKWTLHNIEAAAANVARLIADARNTANVPVIHVRHEFPAGPAPFFVAGSDGAKIHDSVLPKEGEPVITKNQINSFRDTNLKQILDDKDVKNLVICGAMSHMCVDAATRAAADFGYQVTLVHDACASREVEFNGVTVSGELAHAAFMSSLGFAYAKAVTTDAYLAKE